MAQLPRAKVSSWITRVYSGAKEMKPDAPVRGVPQWLLWLFPGWRGMTENPIWLRVTGQRFVGGQRGGELLGTSAAECRNYRSLDRIGVYPFWLWLGFVAFAATLEDLLAWNDPDQSLMQIAMGHAAIFIMGACGFRLAAGSPASTLRSYLEGLKRLRRSTDIKLTSLTGTEILTALVAAYVTRSVRCQLLVQVLVLPFIAAVAIFVGILQPPTQAPIIEWLAWGLQAIAMVTVAFVVVLLVHLNAELLGVISALAWKRYLSLRFPVLLFIQPVIQARAIAYGTLQVIPAIVILEIVFGIISIISAGGWNPGLFETWMLSGCAILAGQILSMAVIASEVRQVVKIAGPEFRKLIEAQAAMEGQG